MEQFADLMRKDAESASGRPATRIPGNHLVRVARKHVAADGVVRLHLVQPEGNRLPHWTPGAHIDLVLPTSVDEPLIRQYSLCGDRRDPSGYEIAVLLEPLSRGGSRYIHENLSVGDMLSLGGPRNNFHLAPAERYLFIAGGIGITPILTMICAAEKLGIDWSLLYGGRTRASMVFLDELEQYGERVTIRPQDEHGLPDLSFLREPVLRAKVYSCGPEGMLAAVASMTPAWPVGSVRFERFVARAAPSAVRSTAFTVDLARSNRTITVENDESVLDAISCSGTTVLASCRQGLCGTCEVTVLDGTPDHRDSLLTEAEQAQGDRMLVCVSRSVTDRLVLDI